MTTKRYFVDMIFSVLLVAGLLVVAFWLGIRWERFTSKPSQAGSALVTPLSRCAPASPSFDDFFDAISAVESNGDDSAVGDDGASQGRYQIGRPYWFDACEFSGVSMDYDEWVTDASQCRRVMEWYFQRYAPQAWELQDWFTLARIHNGGPRGDEKRCTIAYAERVLTAMKGAN